MAIVNRLYTAMDAVQTDLTLSNASGFPATSGVVQIGSEKIHYVISTPSQLLTLTRGYASTSAATHAAGTIVTFVAQDEPAGPNSSNSNINDVPISNGDGTSTWGPDTDSGGGITQLTGDVTAGPGSGSQVAAVASVGGASAASVAAAVTTANNAAPKGAITASGLTQSTAKILGRTTAATGAVEEISVGAGLTLSAGSLSASGGTQVLPQVLFNSLHTQATVTSNAYTAVGPSQAITLQKSSNGVKITTSGSINITAATSQVQFTLFRDGVDLAPTSAGLAYIQLTTGTNGIEQVTLSWLDTPGDTSSHTYQVRIKNGDNSTAMQYMSANSTATILLEEVLS